MKSGLASLWLKVCCALFRQYAASQMRKKDTIIAYEVLTQYFKGRDHLWNLLNIRYHNFTCCFIWLWNSVVHTGGINKLSVFENRVLRWIFGSKREEVAGGWRRLHSEELHKFFASTHIIWGRNNGDWEERGM
jgi:hypothetical protein